MSEKPTSESWDGLLSEYLKAEDLKEATGEIVCLNVDVGLSEKDEPSMVLEVEVSGYKKLWDLNKTNRAKLRELGLARPRDVMGKVIGYKKVNVTNPSTKKEVESLRIVSIR